eukprot:SAG31_NODE_37117_length_307_cov_0.740385_1_plen_59_part_10
MAAATAGTELVAEVEPLAPAAEPPHRQTSPRSKLAVDVAYCGCCGVHAASGKLFWFHHP